MTLISLILLVHTAGMWWGCTVGSFPSWVSDFYHSSIILKRQIQTNKQLKLSDLVCKLFSNLCQPPTSWRPGSSIWAGDPYVQSEYSCRMWDSAGYLQRAETVTAADSHVTTLWITHTITHEAFIRHTGAVHHHVTLLRHAVAQGTATQLPCVLDYHLSLHQEIDLQISIKALRWWLAGEVMFFICMDYARKVKK